MSASGDRLSRLLALVPWLVAHPGVRLEEAADAFGVTAAELRADLELLFCCGLPGHSPGDLLDIAFEGETVTVLDPQTLDRPLRLTADEAISLLAAARGLADLAVLREREALERAIAKLEAALEDSADEVRVVLDPDTGDPAVLERVRAALEQQRRLSLSYLVESRDEVTRREVDPIRLVLRDGHAYLQGWCHRAEAVRLFRLDRVVTAEVLDVPATQVAELPDEPADGVFRGSPEDLLAVIDVDPVGRWVAEYYPCEEVVARPDGGLRVTLRTGELDRLRALLLGLGGHGRPVSPPELIERVRDAAWMALQRYRE